MAVKQSKPLGRGAEADLSWSAAADLPGGRHAWTCRRAELTNQRHAGYSGEHED